MLTSMTGDRRHSFRGRSLLSLPCKTVTLTRNAMAYASHSTKTFSTPKYPRMTCFVMLLALWLVSTLSTFDAMAIKAQRAAHSARRQQTLIRLGVASSGAVTEGQVGEPTQMVSSTAAADNVKASGLMNGLQDLKALQQKSIMTRLGRIVERLRQVILGTKEGLKSLKGVSIIVLDMPPPRDASVKEVENAGVLEEAVDGDSGRGKKCHACELTKKSGRKQREADVVDISDPEVTEDMLQAMTPQEREAFDHKQISTFEAEENVLKGRLTQLMAMEKKEAEFRRNSKSHKKGKTELRATESKRTKTSSATKSEEVEGEEEEEEEEEE